MRNFVIFKRLTGILLITALLGTFAGCKSSPVTDIVQRRPDQTQQAETLTLPPHSNEARSRLTGEWVPADTADNTPVAVMYSNIKDAMPQSSIGSADIVMESLVEGGITRLCAVFENKPELKKIGPVRSCRLYYLFFAKEFEASYVHFGYSDLAQKYLKMPKMHAIDGMVCDEFYRTSDRVAPHNAYISWEGIMANVSSRDYPKTYPQEYRSPLKFTEDDSVQIDLSGNETALACVKFAPGYKHNQPWFEYDADEKVYYRYQFGAPQTDRETGEHLKFKNILVRFVRGRYVDGTPDYRNTGSGEGYYITNGHALPVTWTKSEEFGQTVYTTADGEELTINQGRTFICYIEEQFRDRMTISAE